MDTVLGILIMGAVLFAVYHFAIRKKDTPTGGGSGGGSGRGGGAGGEEQNQQ